MCVCVKPPRWPTTVPARNAAPLAAPQSNAPPPTSSPPALPPRAQGSTAPASELPGGFLAYAQPFGQNNAVDLVGARLAYEVYFDPAFPW